MKRAIMILKFFTLCLMIVFSYLALVENHLTYVENDEEKL